MNTRTATALTGPHADYERIIEPLLGELAKVNGERARKLAEVCYMGYASVRFYWPHFETKYGHEALDFYEADLMKEVGDLLRRNAGAEPLTHDQLKELYQL